MVGAETIDFAIKVAAGISIIPADYKIKIVEGLSASLSADQKWAIVGACSNKPNYTIEITEGISIIIPDLKIQIVTGISSINADKKVCITNADELDVDTLRKLKLID